MSLESDDEEQVELENVTAIAATDKALLCKIDGVEYWVPQSQIHANSEIYKKGHEGRLVISRWFAEKEGLA